MPLESSEANKHTLTKSKHIKSRRKCVDPAQLTHSSLNYFAERTTLFIMCRYRRYVPLLTKPSAKTEFAN